VSGSYHYDLPRIVEIYNHMVATLIVPAPRVAQSVVCKVRRAADSRSGLPAEDVGRKSTAHSARSAPGTGGLRFRSSALQLFPRSLAAWRAQAGYYTIARARTPGDRHGGIGAMGVRVRCIRTHDVSNMHIW